MLDSAALVKIALLLTITSANTAAVLPPVSAVGDDLLSILEKFLPVGCNEWTCVVSKHDEKWGRMNRKEDELRRKFSKLYSAVPLTSNPLQPF